jgi:two-component system CheB/CheR fusion protein
MADRSARAPRQNKSARTSDPSALHTMDGSFADDYLSVVAHDLRGSLNSIIGWAELIRRKALPEDGNVKAGETIIRQANQQLELINEIVDTWRLLSGNLQLKLAPIDAGELVNQAIHAVKESTRKDVTFDLTVEPLPRPLLVDGTRIRQTLIGLFTGAIHFAPEGGTIDVQLRAAGEGVAELTVHDAGEGVDAAALPFLFSWRRQADPARNSARARFGRGLGLIHDIIDLHGGTIKAGTDGATGVTFRVRLPLAAAPRAVHADKAR